MRQLLIIIIMAIFSNCNSNNDLATINNLNIEKYQGTWYEIARLPNSFEKGLKCVTANYTLKKNGKIRVLNKGYSEKKEKYKEAKGAAYVPNQDFPGQLKVTFFWPFAGDYYIITLDEAYQYALVGDPSRKYLWILSRTKQLDENIYNKLTDKAREAGFDVGKLLKIEQDCDPQT